MNLKALAYQLRRDTIDIIWPERQDISAVT